MRTNKCLVIVVAIFLCALSLQVAAEDEYPVAADEFVYCTVCHGAQLMGNPTIRAPRLSQMETWYAERQLNAFKNGIRGTHADDQIGMEMRPMAAALTEDQIDEVASFINTTVSAPPADTISGDAAKGRIHYATCAACHGANGEGNQSLGGPALTVANDWYMVEQLNKFRNGSRGAHAEDTFGSQMRAAVQILTSEQAVIDVVAYINTLRNQ